MNYMLQTIVHANDPSIEKEKEEKMLDKVSFQHYSGWLHVAKQFKTIWELYSENSYPTSCIVQPSFFFNSTCLNEWFNLISNQDGFAEFQVTLTADPNMAMQGMQAMQQQTQVGGYMAAPMMQQPMPEGKAPIRIHFDSSYIKTTPGIIKVLEIVST
ncbi:hypothetical protein CEXT_544461 [Caerostris extrusa]|uniref:Uncharacterized protein n=1 Tax=Caerostris extrusa TaxID=172846 RepID=A0AAV4RQY2_CAEEX|nr:hypothetical protein CEXT_544461 [Caerostris extrusa]